MKTMLSKERQNYSSGEQEYKHKIYSLKYIFNNTFPEQLKKSYKSIRIHCKFMGLDFDTFIKTTDSNSSSENSDRVCTFQQIKKG